MNFSEIKEVISGDPLKKCEEISYKEKTYISINGKIPIKIATYNAILPKNEAIEIFDLDNHSIGILRFPFSVDNEYELTEYELAACYVDSDFDDIGLLRFEIKEAYVIIDSDFLISYIDDFYETAPLWGRFSHSNGGTISKIDHNELRINYVCRFPTIYHSEIATLAASSSNALERFLNYYHLLELLFDYDIVTKIKSMSSDIKDFGNTIAQYNKDDISRLKAVVKDRIGDSVDIDALNNSIIKIDQYGDLAKKIFYDYGKESNPLKKIEAFDQIILSKKIIESDMRVKKVQFENFNDFFLNVILYWLYRIRCCIAHKKIGEYILTISEEKFIVDFAEPLIIELIMQCFKE